MKNWMLIALAVLALIATLIGRFSPNVNLDLGKKEVLVTPVRDTCWTIDSSGNVQIVEIFTLDCPNKIVCPDTTGHGRQDQLYRNTIRVLRAEVAKLTAENARLQAFKWPIILNGDGTPKETYTVETPYWSYATYDTSTLILTEIRDTLIPEEVTAHRKWFLGRRRYEVVINHSNPLIMKTDTLWVPQQ